MPRPARPRATHLCQAAETRTTRNLLSAAKKSAGPPSRPQSASLPGSRSISVRHCPMPSRLLPAGATSNHATTSSRHGGGREGGRVESVKERAPSPFRLGTISSVSNLGRGVRTRPKAMPADIAGAGEDACGGGWRARGQRPFSANGRVMSLSQQSGGAVPARRGHSDVAVRQVATDLLVSAIEAGAPRKRFW